MPRGSKDDFQSYRRSLTKGRKGLRNKSIYGYKQKKSRITLTFIPTLIEKITEVSKQANLFRSEWMEQFFRSYFGISKVESEDN